MKRSTKYRKRSHTKNSYTRRKKKVIKQKRTRRRSRRRSNKHRLKGGSEFKDPSFTHNINIGDNTIKMPIYLHTNINEQAAIGLLEQYQSNLNSVLSNVINSGFIYINIGNLYYITDAVKKRFINDNNMVQIYKMNPKFESIIIDKAGSNSLNQLYTEIQKQLRLT